MDKNSLIKNLLNGIKNGDKVYNFKEESIEEINEVLQEIESKKYAYRIIKTYTIDNVMRPSVLLANAEITTDGEVFLNN